MATTSLTPQALRLLALNHRATDGIRNSEMEKEKRMRLLKIDQVKDKSGLCKTLIYEKMNNGTFPKQIKIGRNSRWLEAEIDAWIEKQVQPQTDG